MSARLAIRTLEPDHIYTQGGFATTEIPTTEKANDSVVVLTPVGVSVQEPSQTVTTRYWQTSMDVVRRTIKACK